MRIVILKCQDLEGRGGNGECNKTRMLEGDVIFFVLYPFVETSWYRGRYFLIIKEEEDSNKSQDLELLAVSNN